MFFRAIRGRDDLGRRLELGVPAAVIRVIVRVDDVLDRLIRHALHLLHDALVILIELVVDQNDAFVGDVDRDVAAVAFDLIQIVLDLVEGQLRGRRVLGVACKRSRPASGTTARRKCA